MKLSLQLILETLTEYGAQLIETDGDFTFTGVQILTSPTDILEPDTLYVCTPKVLPKLKKQLFENHCFVFKAKPSQLQCHHALHGILLDENTDLNEVVNRLITLFTQFHAFEFAIKEASLERRGYEPFFEIAKKAFPHCLIVVTDSAYNIVCSTRSSVDDIPYFRDLLQRGYYSREDMNQIASWGYYEDERKCVQPVLYPAEKTICGYPFLVRSYKNHGAAYCFIGCYFLDVPPTQRDISLYTCLTQELENYYKVNGIFDAGMLGKQQQLLDDLIRPKQNSPEYFHDRCAQLNIPYQGTFRIGLVQCESSTLFKVSHISNQLRAHCPLANYGVFQYGSSVIILFRDWNDANVRTQSGFSEDWNALLTTLRQNKAQLDLDVARKRRAFEQNDELYAHRLIAREEWLQAKEDWELAEKQRELNIERQIQDSLYRTVQVEQMEDNLANMRRNMQLIRQRIGNLAVKSPIDGEIGLLDVVLGQSVASGQKIGQVNDLSDFKVEAQIDEIYIDRVRTGLEASFERQDSNYRMRLRKVYPEVRNNVFRADFNFTGAYPANIRSGQTYYLHLQLGQPTEAVLVPRGTFYQTTGGAWIYVLSPEGDRAYKRPIRIGRQNPQYYEVLEGLQPGERVIVSGYESYGANDVLLLNRRIK